jgi:hypothetical protein
MPSMILRDTRIVTALYDGFSSVPPVTTLAAWNADVTLTFGQPGKETSHVVLWELEIYVGHGDDPSHFLKEAT